VQRTHALRSRARLLVLRSPARTACSQRGGHRVSLSRLPDGDAKVTPDSRGGGSLKPVMAAFSRHYAPLIAIKIQEGEKRSR
jgi:hypothetical protein